MVDDQRGAPTRTADLASALVGVMERRAFGTLHATNAGDCTWHEFAAEICRQADTRVTVEPPARLPSPRKFV